MFNYATETAYSKGTQNDYRFGFFSCGFSASSVETITQPLLPYHHAPHNLFTMLSHTSTFDDRPKTAAWHFRFASPLHENYDNTAIVRHSNIRQFQYPPNCASCGVRPVYRHFSIVIRLLLR